MRKISDYILNISIVKDHTLLLEREDYYIHIQMLVNKKEKPPPKCRKRLCVMRIRKDTCASTDNLIFQNTNSVGGDNDLTLSRSPTDGHNMLNVPILGRGTWM